MKKNKSRTRSTNITAPLGDDFIKSLIRQEQLIKKHKLNRIEAFYVSNYWEGNFDDRLNEVLSLREPENDLEVPEDSLEWIERDDDDEWFGIYFTQREEYES